MWLLGLAVLVAWLVGTLWAVRRADRGQEPYVDPYDWQ